MLLCLINIFFLFFKIFKVLLFSLLSFMYFILLEKPELRCEKFVYQGKFQNLKVLKSSPLNLYNSPSPQQENFVQFFMTRKLDSHAFSLSNSFKTTRSLTSTKINLLCSLNPLHHPMIIDNHVLGNYNMNLNLRCW